MTDKKLLQITKQFTKGMTDGDTKQKCGMVSMALQGYLSAIFGIETEMVTFHVETPTGGWGHCALRLKDGRILDATAGQFDGLCLPNGYLGPMPESYTLEPAP